MEKYLMKISENNSQNQKIKFHFLMENLQWFGSQPEI